MNHGKVVENDLPYSLSIQETKALFWEQCCDEPKTRSRFYIVIYDTSFHFNTAFPLPQFDTAHSGQATSLRYAWLLCDLDLKSLSELAVSTLEVHSETA